MTRDETVGRIEFTLWQHAPVGMAVDLGDGGVLIRCDCQPRDARPLAQADWLRHVAERVADAAMRLPMRED